jgi:hypothetical protein
MRVWDNAETEGETVKKWFCDHCGKRYDAPGVCTDGHPSQPVALQEVDDPVETEQVEPEITAEQQKQNEQADAAEQGKDVLIANLQAQNTDLQTKNNSLTQYVQELEAKLAPPAEAQ